MFKKTDFIVCAMLLLCLCFALAASSFADELLVQTYTAALGGGERTVYVYNVPNYDDDYEQSYRIEVEGMAQPDDMLFTNAEGAGDIELLRFVDIDFDGYLDIAALNTVGATDSFADWFVYDAESGAFVKNEALSIISLYRAELYPQSGLVLNYLHDSAATGTWELYRWEGEDGARSLRLLRTASVLYTDDGTQMRDTVIDLAEDGFESVLYDAEHEYYEDSESYEKGTGELLALLWKGFEAMEAPVPI